MKTTVADYITEKLRVAGGGTLIPDNRRDDNVPHGCHT